MRPKVGTEAHRQEYTRFGSKFAGMRFHKGGSKIACTWCVNHPPPREAKTLKIKPDTRYNV